MVQDGMRHGEVMNMKKKNVQDDDVDAGIAGRRNPQEI